MTNGINSALPHSAYHEPLTPDQAAMLLIDHQTGLMLGCQTLDMQTLRNNVVGLAKVAKLFKIPTLLTFGGANRPGKGVNGPLIPELPEVLPDAQIIDRVMINAWNDSNVVEWVKQTGRKKLIMAGISTDVCLAYPAISAVADGYDVYAVIDASGTWDKTVEMCAMLRMQQAGIIISNWVSIAAKLQKDWTAPSAKDYADIFSKHLAFFNFLVDNLEANGVKVAM